MILVFNLDSGENFMGKEFGNLSVPHNKLGLQIYRECTLFSVQRKQKKRCHSVTNESNL